MADAIIVSNLKITPYTQKDGIAKIVYGDDWSITIKLPTPHQTGDKYAIGLDYENTLYPPNRPLCAGSELYVLNDDELTFTLKLATARLRDWCSKLKKPMPIAIQIVRIRDNKAETLLLDSLLALPSVFDGVVTVYEGDALDERLDEKLDVPPTEGEAGQVLGINEDGQIVWMTIEIPEQEQADWDESDSEAKSYIRNKPEFATVATTGSYNDLTDKPEIPEQKQADWDESDTESPAYIANKPVIPTVNDGKITVNQGGVKKGEFTVNQAGDTVIDLNDGAQSNWDESDSSDVSFIRNKPTLFSGDYNDLSNKPVLATVATSGSYNDLDDKPIITAPVNADWDESDSSDLAYILNKPNLATVATSGSYNDLTDKPEIPEQEQADWEQSDSSAVDYIKNKPTIPYDALDYLCFEAKEANSTVGLNKIGSPDAVSLEYSTDKANWTTYTWESGTGTTITLTNVGDRVWFRGDNSGYCKTVLQHYHKFVGTGSIAVSGNIMSLVDKTCESKVIPSEWCFCGLFSGFTALVDAQELSLPAMTLKRACYYMLFDGCKSLVNAPEILPAMTLVQNCYGGFFYNCTALVNASYLPAKTLVQNCYTNLFYGCSSLNYVKVGFLANNPTVGNNWMAGVSATGTFECPSALDCSNRMGGCIPSGWTIVRSDSVQADWGESTASSPAYVLNKGISTEVAVSDSTYTVNAGTTVPVITVASSLTLSADTVASGKVGYAEVVLDIAANATVTGGTGITFVDTLTAGKRNVCVVRWSGGTSKLYVTIVEDLDESASN